jgi:phage tail sheath protein FI
MIESRYPGVFVSEAAFSAKPIEGVSTSTADLAGMTSLERLARTSNPRLPADTQANENDAGASGNSDAATVVADSPAARTLSTDVEWKYVNVRRYFTYLEDSIDTGLQFAVFEPNGPALWQNVRATVEDFLFNEWQSGALQGTRPEQAYFVKCDSSTMTQNDLDNGRLVLLVGVATIKPGEFVVLHISTLTASANS